MAPTFTPPLYLFLALTAVLVEVVKAQKTCGMLDYLTDDDCPVCYAPCAECLESAPGSCVSCAEGYSGVSQGQCNFTCGGNNTFLDFASHTCSQCKSAHCFENSNFTRQCPGYYRPDTDSCVSSCPVDGGYYQSVAERRCIPCRSKRCQSCDACGNCLRCDSFWRLDRTSGRCLYQCPQGCASCLPDGACLQCESGWISSGRSCICHASNCRECGSGWGRCKSCQEGYFINPQGSCHPCKANCRQCTNSTKCEVCRAGYYLSITEKCELCDIGDRYCSPYGRGSTACENGYSIQYNTANKGMVLYGQLGQR